MVAVPALELTLDLVNRLQEVTGGAVEVFEYMPRAYMERLHKYHPGLHLPFETTHDVNILVEVGTTAPPRVTQSPVLTALPRP